MALSPKHFTFLLFLSLLSSHLGHARDAQFFSKVTPTTATTPTNNAKETIEVPQKEQEYVTKQEQEPRFIPDTQTGYGLYGHESGQFPPTTTRTTTSLPYTTTNNNNNNYYNNEAYASDTQGMSDTRFVDKAYTTPTNDNNNYYNGANNYYNTQQQPNNYYNTQKQGMSDTRFLENGKYYYDGHANGYKYNNKGHYGNFNENSYEQYQNSMEGYQQQNQEEFQEREEEYVP
ncbi:hypothetical protein CEY00_Acc20661 [Actinidia chinensis var. chinensis]|uniref:Protein E6-like n=1 Tax=Actinidia chinensis var. chinensis TaxID=1590841 RepID=A0A2R6QA66_ACTCC|nr:hypothetical protein CEY00_Acc20661 [Actinidia chinensis var. chinensis]